MTRKDYELIANTLAYRRPARNHPGYGAWANIVRDFSRNLQASNQAFDGERFVKACEEL